MAVEDGAIIGSLLGRLNRQLAEGVISPALQRESISEVLRLYEKCQKHRTTTNVQGAINNRHFYHMPDGPEQRARDAELARHTWTNEKSENLWCDMSYNRDLLATDVLAIANAVFDEWLKGLYSKATATEGSSTLKGATPLRGAA